jgi:glycerophosphoryl diester phosphodiesterase
MPFSRSRDRKRFGWIKSVRIAHRGLHTARDHAPENSLRAFACAARRRFAIEFDVHLSADGVVMVFHDETLDRMTQAKGRLSLVNAATLQSLPLSGTDERIPTLKQVLDLVAGQVGILVELKTENAKDDRLEQAVARLLANYRGPVAVQSFNPRTVAWFANHFPNVPRGQLSMDFRRGSGRMSLSNRRRLTAMSTLERTRADFIGYHVQAMPNFSLTNWRKLGVPVLAWTVRNMRQFKCARRFADNIIFEGDYP